jgi:hypothetical protein
VVSELGIRTSSAVLVHAWYTARSGARAEPVERCVEDRLGAALARRQQVSVVRRAKAGWTGEGARATPAVQGHDPFPHSRQDLCTPLKTGALHDLDGVVRDLVLISR